MVCRLFGVQKNMIRNTDGLFDVLTVVYIIRIQFKLHKVWYHIIINIYPAVSARIPVPMFPLHTIISIRQCRELVVQWWILPVLPCPSHPVVGNILYHLKQFTHNWHLPCSQCQRYAFFSTLYQIIHTLLDTIWYQDFRNAQDLWKKNISN